MIGIDPDEASEQMRRLGELVRQIEELKGTFATVYNSRSNFWHGSAGEAWERHAEDERVPKFDAVIEALEEASNDLQAAIDGFMNENAELAPEM